MITSTPFAPFFGLGLVLHASRSASIHARADAVPSGGLIGGVSHGPFLEASIRIANVNEVRSGASPSDRDIRSSHHLAPLPNSRAAGAATAGSQCDSGIAASASVIGVVCNRQEGVAGVRESPHSCSAVLQAEPAAHRTEGFANTLNVTEVDIGSIADVGSSVAHGSVVDIVINRAAGVRGRS